SWPQPPQLASVSSGDSQPLLALASQLPKPALHEMLHAPPLHDGVPLAAAEDWPRPPQCDRSPGRSVSQPLPPALASQLPKPGAHEMLHAPPLHDGVPFAPLQELPHAPQFARSAASECSQPFERSPSQLPKPLSQSIPHCPLEQV